MTSTQQRTLVSANCEIAFDNLTRQLYATDASLYQIEPQPSPFRATREQARASSWRPAMRASPSSPRGAGTGLAGGAIGDGLIIDFSRHNRQITELRSRAAHGAGRRGRRARSAQRLSQAPRLLFRSGCRDQFAGDARRDDREQFLRRARAGLWHDGGPRARAGDRAGRRPRSKRSDPVIRHSRPSRRVIAQLVSAHSG